MKTEKIAHYHNILLLPSRLLSALVFLGLISCGAPTGKKKLIKLPNNAAKASVAMLGVSNAESLKEQALAAGLEVSGKSVIIIEGDSDKIEQLQVYGESNFSYELDRAIEVEVPESFTPQEPVLYQAKKDFGLIDFWKDYPTADGRGVSVGVIDDGISPHQQGFVSTSHGKRKLLEKNSQSTMTHFKLQDAGSAYTTTVDETRTSFAGRVDLNRDGKTIPWQAYISKDLTRVCTDNVRDFYASNCTGIFSLSGEYLTLENSQAVLVFEIVQKDDGPYLHVLQPETRGDSHGEGVASVLAGHQIGGVIGFDGVAPGAQIYDYDLSQDTNKAQEYQYSLNTFLKALTWLGEKGVKVANISYSLGFTSAQTQVFMSRALEQIIQDYNMIISFSAGNNGPGLGSFNRSAIYPSSALVAGAYVSKELDEYVHGNTGIPEEGRIIYYSSRGPGPTTSPLMIAPLSSLVNASPDDGHRGFSGTSSASPALAGAATVLVSAIMQSGMPFDAASAVHALRQSGKRLSNEPFIFQGYGLPQVGQALEIYKKIISAQNFQNLEVAVSAQSTDDINASSIFIKASESQRMQTYRISLEGILSNLAPQSAKLNKVSSVNFTYPEWVSGPRHGWISSNTYRMFVDVDVHKAIEGKLESFGEIMISNSESGELMGIIPVTVVNDRDVRAPIEHTFTLNSQEGLRLPIHVAQEVKGIRIQAQVLEGEVSTPLISVFDPHQIRKVQKRLGTDLYQETKEKGFYQIGIGRTGGSSRKTVVRIRVSPIILEVNDLAIDAQDARLHLRNHSDESLNGSIELVGQGELVAAKFLSSDKVDEGLELEVASLNKGLYRIEFAPQRKAQLQYFFGYCATTATNTQRGSKSFLNGSAFNVFNDNTMVQINCMPFDYGASFPEHEKISWYVKLWTGMKTYTRSLQVAPGSEKTQKFKKIEPGIYRVVFSHEESKSSIELGTIEAF